MRKEIIEGLLKALEKIDNLINIVKNSVHHGRNLLHTFLKN